ncbi:hypothetical protein GALL_534110 [mine drainage metagenome]|uniref:Uncharacterized protein n=1 Tax=mine drainage metagenome TaxID=410659 RepID=A0A1J5P0F9_9ZZZZ
MVVDSRPTRPTVLKRLKAYDRSGSIVTVGESPLQSNGNFLEHKKQSCPIEDIGEITLSTPIGHKISKSIRSGRFWRDCGHQATPIGPQIQNVESTMSWYTSPSIYFTLSYRWFYQVHLLPACLQMIRRKGASRHRAPLLQTILFRRDLYLRLRSSWKMCLNLPG